MHRDRGTEDLALELEGVTALIYALSTQFDSKLAPLTHEYIQNALCGISFYLERISDDLSEIKTIQGRCCPLERKEHHESNRILC